MTRDAVSARPLAVGQMVRAEYPVEEGEVNCERAHARCYRMVRRFAAEGSERRGTTFSLSICATLAGNQQVNAPGRNTDASPPRIPASGRWRRRAPGAAASRIRASLSISHHHHGRAGARRRRSRYQRAPHRLGHVGCARPDRGDRERDRCRGLDRHRPDRARDARRLQHPVRRQRHARAQSRGAQSQLRRGQRFRADRADRQHAVAVRREERPAGQRS